MHQRYHKPYKVKSLIHSGFLRLIILSINKNHIISRRSVRTSLQSNIESDSRRMPKSKVRAETNLNDIVFFEIMYFAFGRCYFHTVLVLRKPNMSHL